MRAVVLLADHGGSFLLHDDRLGHHRIDNLDELMLLSHEEYVLNPLVEVRCFSSTISARLDSKTPSSRQSPASSLSYCSRVAVLCSSEAASLSPGIFFFRRRVPLEERESSLTRRKSFDSAAIVECKGSFFLSLFEVSPSSGCVSSLFTAGPSVSAPSLHGLSDDAEISSLRAVTPCSEATCASSDRYGLSLRKGGLSRLLLLDSGLFPLLGCLRDRVHYPQIPKHMGILRAASSTSRSTQ